MSSVLTTYNIRPAGSQLCLNTIYPRREKYLERIRIELSASESSSPYNIAPREILRMCWKLSFTMLILFAREGCDVEVLVTINDMSTYSLEIGSSLTIYRSNIVYYWVKRFWIIRASKITTFCLFGTNQGSCKVFFSFNWAVIIKPCWKFWKVQFDDVIEYFKEKLSSLSCVTATQGLPILRNPHGSIL